MAAEPLINPFADPAMWRPGVFVGVLAEEVDGKPFGQIRGVLRGAFAVSPDSHDTPDHDVMPVGVTHLPSGCLLFQAPNGAKAMLCADAVSVRWPRIFCVWPWDVEALAAAADDIRQLIQGFGCIPTLD